MIYQTTILIEKSDISPGESIVADMPLANGHLKVEYFETPKTVRSNRFNYAMSVKVKYEGGSSGMSWTWLRKGINAEYILHEINARLGFYRVCPLCGGIDEASGFYYCDTNQMALIGKDEDMYICLHCNHWLRYLEKDKGQDHWYNGFVVEGRHYAMSEPGTVKRNSNMLGFGGSYFTVEHLETGDKVVTNNLWTQGKITDYFKPFFPDTAKFIKE